MNEAFLAYFTFVRLLFFGNMCAHVVVEVVFFGEASRTELAFVRPVFDVGTKVLPEGLHVNELFLAYVALVHVTLQLL